MFIWNCFLDWMFPEIGASDQAAIDKARRELADSVQAFKEGRPRPERLPAGTDPGWLNEYARWTFDHCLAMSQALDDRADHVLRYLGTLVSATTIAAVVTLSKDFFWPAFFAIPSFIFAVYSAVLAVQARMSSGLPQPPSALYASKLFLARGDDGQILLAMQWHPIIEMRWQLIEEKSRRMVRSMRYFALTLVGLGMPLFAQFLAVFIRPSC
ncbi:MAG TPA: hypothetical protein VNC50_01125 [Planctomycetia bacterium]|nr:hypothetical protein [Planctomycetia bacterium]